MKKMGSMPDPENPIAAYNTGKLEGIVGAMEDTILNLIRSLCLTTMDITEKKYQAQVNALENEVMHLRMENARLLREGVFPEESDNAGEPGA